MYLFFQGFRLLQRRQLILNTPVSKVRGASLGMVELSGLAVGPYTIFAPITERACYYYRTIAWEWKRQGRSSQWVQVANECMHVPFFLDDNTGKVMVDPRGAGLDLHRDFRQEFCDSFFTTKEEAPDNVRGFLLRHGVSTTNKIKVEEFCIKPKNALFLLGTLSENPGLKVTPEPVVDTEHLALTGGNGSSFWWGASIGLSSTSLQDRTLSQSLVRDRYLHQSEFTRHPGAASRVIHLSPDAPAANAVDMTQQQKIAAALLKAGISSPAAWAVAQSRSSIVAVGSDPNGTAYRSQPAIAHASPQATAAPDDFDANPPVVLMKGQNNPTFLISWRSQHDLARSLGWRCALMIWGGPALFLLCLYGLHALTHWF